MDTGDKKKKKILKKTIRGHEKPVTVKKEGTYTTHPGKKKGADGKLKVRTKVDKKGDAYYRNAKEPGFKTVKKTPAFDSKKRKVSKRKYGRLVKRS